MRTRGVWKTATVTVAMLAILSGPAWTAWPALAAGQTGMSSTSSMNAPTSSDSGTSLSTGSTSSDSRTSTSTSGQTVSGTSPTASDSMTSTSSTSRSSSKSGTSKHDSGAGSSARGLSTADHAASTSTKSSQSDHGVGRQISAVIQSALSGGTTGTALANAVHEVIATEQHNAKGLTVAMAVYQQLTSQAGTAGSQTSGTSSAGFSDLSQTPWARAAVDALHQAGVINGTAPGTFSPNQPVTLAELATMLAHLQAGSATSTSNVPAATPTWARNALAWALTSGVLSGIQGLGTPDAPLTRAQAVRMLINAAGLGHLASTLTATSITLSGQVPSWARGALSLAIQLGLVQGSGGKLLADQPLTRAQVAVLLARLSILEAETASAG